MAKNKDKLVIFYSSWYDILAEEEKPLRLELLDALIRYGKGDDVKLEELSDKARLPFKIMKAELDRYEEKRQSNSRAGMQGMEKRWHSKDNADIKGDKEGEGVITKDNDDITTDNGVITKNNTEITTDNIYKSKSKSIEKENRVRDIDGKESIEKVADAPTTRFTKPTLQEVKDYCSLRRNSVNAERFIAYYDSNGWMVGRNKMKDWKAAVRTWEQGDKQFGSGKGPSADYLSRTHVSDRDSFKYEKGGMIV